jgi:hypothetical protein
MTRARTSLSSVAIAVFLVAVAARLAPLFWSPYPATLDGIMYARLAGETLQAGLPVSSMRADAVTSTLLLTIVGQLLDVRPLVLAQPLYAIIGGTTAVIAVAFARRVCSGLGWPRRRVRVAAVAGGLLFALEGLYVRRTGIPDDDAITLLFIPLFVLALFELRRTRRRAWLGVFLLLFVVLPLTHTLSTYIAALCVLALLAAQIGRYTDRRDVLVSVGLGLGFSAYFGGYYYLAPRLGFTVPYVDRVTGNPGLFVAWLIVLVIGTAWFAQTAPRFQRLAFLAPVALFFTVVGVNLVTTVFPGTVRTPPEVAATVLPLIVIVAFGAWALPRAVADWLVGPVLLALLAAPVVQVLFALTAGLTPEYFATAMRSQTFAHPTVLVLAGLTIARVAPVGRAVRATSRSGVGRLLVIGVVLVSLGLTMPVAYLDADTGEYPSTTTEPEFETATFAVGYVPGEWTSGHAMTRIAGNYYAPGAASVEPTATWVRGGPAPACPAISEASWATRGVHLFPTVGDPVSESTYRGMLRDRHVVYAASGSDPLAISLPRTASDDGC